MRINGLNQIIRFQHRTESAAYFIRLAETPWGEILKTQLLALKRQIKLSCPCRTLLYVCFRPNALHWAELN